MNLSGKPHLGFRLKSKSRYQEPLVEITNHNSPGQKILISWIIVGLTVLHGLRFWPISNYSTLVYLLFFTPLLIQIIVTPRLFVQLFTETDRTLSTLVIALFFWVMISTFYNQETGGNVDALKKTLKPCVLILSYLAGVAFLTKHYPTLLLNSMITAAFLIAVLSACTIVNEYIAADTFPLRLTDFSVAKSVRAINPAVAGIYFGVFSIISGAMLISNILPTKLIPFGILICVILCLLVTLLTGTRSALVGLFCSTLVCLVLQRKFVFAVYIIMAIVFIITYSIFDESSYLHNYLLRGGLGSRRPEIWSGFWSSINQNFWFGKGMWYQPDFSVTKYGITTSPSHAHNFYLQLMYWTGAIGLTLYLGVLFRALKLGLSENKNRFSFIAILTLCYFLPVQFFDVFNIFTSPSYYWPCIWFPIAIIFGISKKSG